MEPELARRYGSLYVHLAALAIDLDRIAEHVEDEPEDDWPFAWEVFLTEFVFLAKVDLEQAADLALVEEVCASALAASEVAMSSGAGSQGPLGAQVLFAAHDAISRGDWPDSLAPLFANWEADGTLGEALEPLWEVAETAAADLAALCLKVELDPPIAPTTQALLEAIVDLEDEGDGASPHDGA